MVRGKLDSKRDTDEHGESVALVTNRRLFGADRWRWVHVSAHWAVHYEVLNGCAADFARDHGDYFRDIARLGCDLGPLGGLCQRPHAIELGRRRSWLLWSIVPVAGMFIMVFSPPAGLQGTALVIWMAIGVIGFYSAMTLFMVPHLSLGPELTNDYHERSRLYGFRHAAYTVGSIIALISMQLLIDAEQVSSEKVRETAFELSTLAGLITAALITFAVIKLRERHDLKVRVGQTPFGALKMFGLILTPGWCWWSRSSRTSAVPLSPC